MNPRRYSVWRDRPGSNEIRRILAVSVFFLCIAAAGSILAWLPVLWWHGGGVSLTLPASGIQQRGGVAFSINLWPLVKRSYPRQAATESREPVSYFFRIVSDSPGKLRSTLELYEDGLPLGPPHSGRSKIYREGFGRYSHVARELVFSTSDNSDPRSNGRTYTIKRVCQPRLDALPLATATGLWLLAIWAWCAALWSWRRVILFIESSGPLGLGGLYVLFAAAFLSMYSFGFAALGRPFAVKSFAVLALFGALTLVARRRPLVFRPWMIWLFALIGYSTLTTALGSTKLSSWQTSEDMLLFCVFGLVIYSAMFQVMGERVRTLRLSLSALFVVLALAIALQNCGFEIKQSLSSLYVVRSLPWQLDVWNQKFQETWLVMLTWIVVCGIRPWREKRKRWGEACVVLLTAGVAVASGYSNSVKAAYCVAVVIFFGTLVSPIIVRTCLAVLFTGAFLTAPLLAGGAWKIYSTHNNGIGAEGTFGEHITRRLLVWEYSRSLIFERPVFGWGLGTCENLPGRRVSAREVMAEGAEIPSQLAEAIPLPGGHPHSLPLLIWIETGFVGASLAAGLLVTTFRYLRSVSAVPQQAALLALIASYLLIFSTNYPAWDSTLQMLTFLTLGLVNSNVLLQQPPLPTREGTGAALHEDILA